MYAEFKSAQAVASAQPASGDADSERVRRVFAEHGRTVLRYLRVLGVPERDLDDSLQEVFLVVCRVHRNYEERGRMRSWLFSICRRVHWRRRRVLVQRREDLVEQPEPGVALHRDPVALRDALMFCQQLLQSLTPAQRDVFWLYRVEQHTMAEIARVMGCPLQTAYSRLITAQQRLVAAMQRADQGRRLELRRA